MQRLLCAGLFALFCAPPARAQYIMEFAQTYAAPMSNFINGTVLNNLGMINATVPDKPLRATAAPQVARNARTLAERFPQPQRAKMEPLFIQIYDGYRKLEARFGWQKDDLAGALAAFVVGNYMAYTGADVDDAVYVAVADQFRGNPRMAESLGKLAPADLRSMYEQTAMVGTFMALTVVSQAQMPQSAEVRANLRDTASANLRQVLGMDPARVRIGADGLKAR